MFGRRNELLYSAMTNFDKNNKSGYLTDFYTMYMTLIESRMSNDLRLIGDPELCHRLGLDIEMLNSELQDLIALRQEVSFSLVDKRTDGRGGR